MSLKSVMEYPDISFIDNLTQEDLLDKMIAWFLEKRKELTGKDISLGYADDRRLILQTGAYYIYQAFMMTDNAGKMGLLKYATGDFLEELGALKGVPMGASVVCENVYKDVLVKMGGNEMKWDFISLPISEFNAILGMDGLS